MTTTLNFLCAGAAQGLLKALQQRYTEATGATLQGRFGAVGAMKEALQAGEPCDLMVVTDSMIAALVGSGELAAAGRAPLGRVRTGIAVRTGEALPSVGTAQGLKQALLAADAIYFPDPERATAGIHFAAVMRRLGIFETLQARFRTYPAGAIAMRELAANPAPRLIGCTQITEINYTEGVQLVGALPDEFELATVYSAAVATRSAQPALAAQLIDWLTGPSSRELRLQGGFED